ncbi:AraC family transcriptional regulator [Alkalilimnicola ehrlichii]|uniref:AraC family transcriptional regulator n=1 Tax=Alkalilimnicola ehrlichii TaxID=351052 RepID=A0A3E0WM11_9GAMM|nr:AraC family transcriptional regulator [Alkalilimnicola ehrlichii]RFA26386.1 AraC family transcriptional regulator [Alkalilimnicola ehrlichii]RFA33449.1 AraC family transcriptional regulator [Alkalilimnicola ehrlichii]
MIELLYRLAPQEGYTQSLLNEVRFMRSDRPLKLTPVLYEPSIVIVCQGRKRGYLGDEVYLYDALHYLVLSVPLPFTSDTEASPEEPLLAISIRLNMSVVAELAFMLDQPDACSAAPPRGMLSTPLDAPMSDATLRLLEALGSPTEAQVLAPSIVREICYRVLVGEQGGSVRAALAQQGQFGRIAKALHRIHEDYAEPLEVGYLASEVGMSTAVFHVHFKAVTQTTPLQYIKSTRLHQARMLMIRDGLPAAAAAARVGYESPSQFSREFKRFFGRPPGEEVREMKALLTLLPPERVAGLAVPH